MKSGSAYHGGAIGARSDVVWPLMIVARIDGAIQSAWACVPALRVGAVSEGIGAARYIVVEHGDDQLLRVDLYAYEPDVTTPLAPRRLDDTAAGRSLGKASDRSSRCASA